jgi:ariadne-1
MTYDIVDTLGVSEEVAKSLLLKYRWDKEEVINRFTDYDNLLLKVFNYDMSKSVQKVTGSFLCPVCYEEKSQAVSLECGHSFCSDCFSDYL